MIIASLQLGCDTMSTFLNLSEDLLYPESDGEPMAESTEQYRWIVMVKENLEILFRDHPNVFIAADLFWYPTQVSDSPAPRQAPDVMVVFGRPKGARRSYKQWQEDNTPAQVVFEILSASNKTRDGLEAMDFKLLFYQKYGVEEYYIYDPDEFTLEGWQRQGSLLVQIPQMSGWVSPRLQIRFEWQPRAELTLYGLDGRRFLSSVELKQQLEQERFRAEQERFRAEQAEQTLREAVPRLLALGLTLEQIAQSLGLAIADIQAIAHEIEP
jgi:Uma2 family endonuclease